MPPFIDGSVSLITLPEDVIPDIMILENGMNHAAAIVNA